jgi:hypothetical protein
MVPEHWCDAVYSSHRLAHIAGSATPAAAEFTSACHMRMMIDRLEPAPCRLRYSVTLHLVNSSPTRQQRSLSHSTIVGKLSTGIGSIRRVQYKQDGSSYQLKGCAVEFLKNNHRDSASNLLATTHYRATDTNWYTKYEVAKGGSIVDCKIS